MILDFKTFKKFIKEDAKSRGIKLSILQYLKDPILRFQISLRVYEFCLNKKLFKPLRLLVYLYHKSLSIKLGFSIPPNVFDSGLAIVHYGNIIISPYTRIGKNCRIHVGVNIGGAGKLTSVEEAKFLDPTIGNNCYIGPGAKLYGPIVLGDNVVIGANAVVGKSFEGNNLVLAGVPAKIISNTGSEGMLIKGAS